MARSEFCKKQPMDSFSKCFLAGLIGFALLFSFFMVWIISHGSTETVNKTMYYVNGTASMDTEVVDSDGLVKKCNIIFETVSQSGKKIVMRPRSKTCEQVAHDTTPENQPSAQ